MVHLPSGTGLMLRERIARALTARQDGKLRTALAEARELVALAPETSAFHQFIGEIHVQLGEMDAALEAYERAAVLAPAEPTLRRAVALLALNAGRPRLAADHLAALEAPEADDIANLADALASAGDRNAAIAAYERLLRLRPDSVDALVALSSQLIKAGRHAEAEPPLRRALDLAPDDAGALTDLGLVILERGEPERAIPLLERAAGRSSPSLESLVALSTARQNSGQAVGAIEAARAAAALAPPDDIHVGFALAAALTTLGDGAEAAALLRRCREAGREPVSAVSWPVQSRLLFSLQYVPELPPAEMLAEARRCNRLISHIRPPPPPPRSWDPGRRLRVGYVSTDFREHACRYYLEPLIRHHDREAVEVFCYAELGRPDAVTGRFQAMADHWRRCADQGDEALAETIRTDGIDILVDLCGHAAGNRMPVFAHRPAPVQVATLIGYSATTGFDGFDYLLGDPHLTPPERDADFSETVIRLPRIIAPFQPRDDWPEIGGDDGDDGIVFGCVAEAARVDRRTMATWRRLLERVPHSRILFKQAQFNDAPTRQAWAARLAEPAGLGELAGRVDLEGIPGGWGRNMGIYSRLTAVLDSPLHSGNTTVLIPLWMGVPVVTLAGPNSWQRAGASILANAGLPDLIARTDEEYVEIAAGLAADPERRRRLRHGLRAMMLASPVCDARPVVADLEAAYRGMWRAACAGRS
ncbi:tetratricopeptide repeat protein [Magnetospirillum sp. SS-4]|uniref:O-linked N-acetylglucosamine transferase, SPINDLY family protein n=1 Tax=Magnetospirillum sp. SS-4 TaxID=2681465 RepID=UPI00137CAEB8|nr:tetratricopeptide repeat protein [Magnetospirillum sp. SS-4]CAA7616747.1 conserved hypothetical protein [Magnetospirillum sp. SS-4]